MAQPLGQYVTLKRGTTYEGMKVGLPGPLLLGIGSIVPGGGFREENCTTFAGFCPEDMMVQSGDLYVALKGATKDNSMIGSVARLPANSTPGRLTQDTARLDLLSTDEPRIASHLYWILQTPAYRAYCAGRATGTGAVALQRNDFLAYSISDPTQQSEKLVSLLDDIEHHILLTKRMNGHLDQYAKSAFHAWFSHLEPVSPMADQALPKKVVQHFKGTPVDTEIGLLPPSWSVGSIGAICEVIDCLHSRKPVQQTTGLPLLQLNNISSDGLIDLTEVFHVSEQDYKLWTSRMEVREGDCVITNVGRVAAVAQIPPRFKAAMGRNMTGLRLKPQYPFPTFLVECLRSVGMKEEIAVNTDNGTIMNALNVRNIPKLRVPLPPSDVLEAFENLVRPVRALMEQNQHLLSTLANSRNALLYRLQRELEKN